MSLFGAVADHYVAAGGGGGSYSAAVLANSPLAYYRLGEASGGPAISAATSSTNFVSEPPSNAIDGNPATFWTTSSGNNTGWLRIQLTTAAVATVYYITRRDDIPARNPKNWTFEGSNDGTTFTTLDTQTGITWATVGERRRFTFSNTTSYLYYRLNVTLNNGDSFLSVAELGFLSAVDASGNGRHGVYSGTLTLGTTGLLTGDSDTAVTFGGGRVTVGSPTWLDGLSAFTISGIINPSVVSGTRMLAGHDNEQSPPGRHFQFRLNSGKLEGILQDSSGSAHTATGTTVLSTGVKTHVSMRWNGTTLAVLLAGVVNGSTSVSSSSTGNSGQPLILAGAPFTTDYAGVMDEVAIFGTALSDATLAAQATAI